MYKLLNTIFQAVWRLGQYDVYTQSMIFIMLGFLGFLYVG